MFKKLMEKRAALQAEMEVMLNLAETEERALTEEEQTKFDNMEKEIRAIDKTIEKANASRDLHQEEQPEERASEDVEEAEMRAFEAYIRGTVTGEQRANLADGSNGAILPKTVAAKVIAKVREISPIMQMADVYNVGGQVSIPAYTEDSTDHINVAYATEFTDLTANGGKMVSIDLKGFLAGALTKVSKSLIRNANFDVVSFVVERMAEAIAAFIEGEALNGTPSKIDGMSKATQVKNAASATAITADELIDLQEMIPDRYQANACWIMNKATRTAIRKLKDNDGNYLLNKDATAKWGYTLFGKDVYVSDNAKPMATKNTTVFYGDFSGLAIQIGESVEIEMLNELYAAQHAVGVVGFVEVDAKIEDQQKIAVLKMA